MKLFKLWKSLLAVTSVIVITFVLVSFLDIAIAVIYARFYSQAAFIVTFGVGGIFAAAFGYIYGMDLAPVKNESSRWTLILAEIIVGALFFFFLAKLEGGEYKAAFKAFGATLALGSLLFVKGKISV